MSHNPDPPRTINLPLPLASYSIPAKATHYILEQRPHPDDQFQFIVHFLRISPNISPRIYTLDHEGYPFWAEPDTILLAPTRMIAAAISLEKPAAIPLEKQTQHLTTNLSEAEG